MSEVIINTPRLLLKGISPQVIHAVFTTKTENEVKAYFGVDEKGYQHFKEMHLKGMETHRLSLFFFLLIDKGTNVPIGECGFHTWNRTHKRAELFYLLRHVSYMQKGLMTEALNAVLEYGFVNLGLHRIEALVANSNIPSIKLLERHRFLFEGTMREDYIVDDKSEDSECYSLLKHEWLSVQHKISSE
jgi:ribosomal-protein-alanine N-acetyltransferase